MYQTKTKTKVKTKTIFCVLCWCCLNYLAIKLAEKELLSMASKLLLTFAICRLIVTVGLTMDPTELLRLGVYGQLSVDPFDVQTASLDFGMLSRAEPWAVLHPASADDITRVVKAAYESEAHGFTISARGHGHSINGQAQTSNGVVIQMSGSRGRRLGSSTPAALRPHVYKKERYVDVWGGELWIDVLRSTLEHGLAPKSWTDYLYLSVGGTLSNAGISGQAFHQGPQITNVHELDVVTGSFLFNLFSCMRRSVSILIAFFFFKLFLVYQFFLIYFIYFPLRCFFFCFDLPNFQLLKVYIFFNHECEEMVFIFRIMYNIHYSAANI